MGNGPASTFHVIVRLAARIGADHLETIVTAHAPMACAGRKDQHIAGLQPNKPTIVATQPQRYPALGDAERLMGIGIKIRVVVNRVGPYARPAGTLETPAEDVGFACRVKRQHGTV